MNEKSIVIRHNNGFATSIFILQTIFILMIFLYLVYDFAIKLIHHEEIKTIFYFIIGLILLVSIRLFKYLKEIYSLKEYIVTDSKIIIDKVEYNLDDVALRYVSPLGRSTLLVAELFIKEKNKVIGLFIISIWAGHVLNVTSETLNKIFEEKSLTYNDIKPSTKASFVDMDAEEKEIKQVDTAWNLTYVFLLVPIIFILYLMVQNN